MQKTPTAAISERRRPQMSPIGADINAPTTVPALNMATINEISFGDMVRFPALFLHPELKCSTNESMARMPLIVLQTAHSQRPRLSSNPPDKMPLVSRRAQCRLPRVVSKQQSAGGDEEPDHDGRRGGAGDIVGLVPAHGYRHGDCGGPVKPDSMSVSAGLSRVSLSIRGWIVRFDHLKDDVPRTGCG